VLDIAHEILVQGMSRIDYKVNLYDSRATVSIISNTIKLYSLINAQHEPVV
jgi:hypothetical protein